MRRTSVPKIGKREDLGNIRFRSGWEANYARYLNLLVEQNRIARWEYECKTFTFEKISRGNRTYMPDFKVTLLDGAHEWHEVKGYMDPASRTKLARMARYFPDETVKIIDRSWFQQARRSGLAGAIYGWE